jgi:hypothetical protein
VMKPHPRKARRSGRVPDAMEQFDSIGSSRDRSRESRAFGSVGYGVD